MRDAACEAKLSAWCHDNCVHSSSYRLYARFDTDSRRGAKAWRCYARQALSQDLTRYIGGTAYCTRHSQLVELYRQCRPPSPQLLPPSPPPITHSVGVSPLGQQDYAKPVAEGIAARPTGCADGEICNRLTPLPPPKVVRAATPAEAGSATPPKVEKTAAEGSVAPRKEPDTAVTILEPWPVERTTPLTVAAVDTSSWAPTAEHELLHVHAWEVPCIDSYSKHTLKNYTGNVSRRKAFLDRTGLLCHGRCVRGVVDGFATHAEIAEMLRHAPEMRKGDGGQPGTSNIATWRWDVQAGVFRTLVSRAQAVMRERYGVQSLRFYRSNIIVWDGAQTTKEEWPSEPLTWKPRSLHGDTNTDEMFLFTTILYLSQHGDDVVGGETGIADEIDGTHHQTLRGLRVEPSIGRLLIFSSGVENMHEMLPVTHGRRVACQMWFACEGMDPGWARPQRVAFEQEWGYGGADAHIPNPTPTLSAELQSALATPWPWRS